MTSNDFAPKTVKKRFIAGAICPRCKELDKLMMYKLDGQEVRECVACDFKDELQFKQSVRELDTRVNLTEQKIAEETQVIRLIKE
jgi:uncharacterized metal-binding protein (TIGR02443 family)